MTDISLKFLSNEIKISIKELIKELSDIGIVKNEKDQINLIEKNNLLKHLESKKKSSLDTLILQRKTRSTLSVSTTSGKNKSIQVEVRKKRTYIKNNKFEADFSSNITSTNKILIKQEYSLKNLQKNNINTSIEKNTIDKKT